MEENEDQRDDPTVDEIKRGFESIEGSMTEPQMVMLRAHYSSGGRAVTMRELATASGYGDYKIANIQYGTLGKRLLAAIGREVPKYKGHPIALLGLGKIVERKKFGLEMHLVMHDSVAKALEELGWVQPPAASEKDFRHQAKDDQEMEGPGYVVHTDGNEEIVFKFAYFGEWVEIVRWTNVDDQILYRADYGNMFGGLFEDDDDGEETSIDEKLDNAHIETTRGDVTSSFEEALTDASSGFDLLFSTPVIIHPDVYRAVRRHVETLFAQVTEGYRASELGAELPADADEWFAKTY